MIRRQIQARVNELLSQFPAVVILGPRQVGKTTLALALAEELGDQARYLDLELPSERTKLREPERWAIEIKRSLSDPSPSKGFYIGCQDIRASRQIVIYPGEDSYPLDAKTQVMPLEKLLEEDWATVGARLRPQRKTT